MPERTWRGLLVTTDEWPGDRDTPPSSTIVKVEVEDLAVFEAAFPDEVADRLDIIARTLLFENEDAFWSEASEVEDD